MSITTKTGDSGTTGDFNGNRLIKDHPQVEAIGSIDEATVFIGYARESLSDKATKHILNSVQLCLYQIMGMVSGAPTGRLFTDEIALLEKKIIEMEHKLPPLSRFVLPQGGERALRFHMARTAVRKAERRLVAYIHNEEKNKILIPGVTYLNRLSDYLFMLARFHSTDETIT